LADKEEQPPDEEPAEPSSEPPVAEPPSEKEIKDPFERETIRYETRRWNPTLVVGESLVGEGNEVAHVDLLIGSKSGPVGEAFAQALVNQKEGHTNLLAVVAPNLPAKPDTIMSNKVTIKGATQAVQMFGPAQAAVARGVVDSVREGVISEADVDDLCIIAGVFIHWEATDDKKIFDNNYQATKEAIARALANEPNMSAVLEAVAIARHSFASDAEHW
jgi:5,6,7,8-tetrahydromethanopterin hydro-lyase